MQIYGNFYNLQTLLYDVCHCLVLVCRCFKSCLDCCFLLIKGMCICYLIVKLIKKCKNGNCFVFDVVDLLI